MFPALLPLPFTLLFTVLFSPAKAEDPLLIDCGYRQAAMDPLHPELSMHDIIGRLDQRSR